MILSIHFVIKYKYIDGGDDYIRGLIAMAEGMSYSICESCGNKGKTGDERWVSTFCDLCRENIHNERKKRIEESKSKSAL